MNDYRPEQGYVPPGWDEWYAYSHGYYNYVLNENGTPVRYGDTAADYSTDVFAGHAAAAIRRAAAGRAPFFFIVAPFAPHSPERPAPRHTDLFADAEIGRASCRERVCQYV